MKLIIGLGNFEDKYLETRHNLGWKAVTAFAIKQHLLFKEDRRLHARITEGFLGAEKVMLALPTTYMNLSGEAVAALVHYYHLSIADVLVVQDELDIPLGSFRFSLGGSAAGHNGIRSIAQSLGDETISRLRLGIGRPSHPQLIEEYVLEKFSKDEQPITAKVIDEGSAAIQDWIEHGLDKSMQLWNGKKV